LIEYYIIICFAEELSSKAFLTIY